MIRALILDYGGVLTEGQATEHLARVIAELGVNWEQFTGVYWQHRPAYDQGLAGSQYWSQVLADLGVRTFSQRLLDALVEADLRSWTHYREDMWHLAASFRQVGKTAFLSNNVHELMARIQSERPLGSWFDVVIASCDLGITKPDPRIFWQCLGQLGLGAPECLFVDDRPANVKAAAGLGFQTCQFAGDVAGLRAQIALLTGR